MKFGELSSLFYGVIILGLFISVQLLGFNPRSDWLAAFVAIIAVISLSYLWTQIVAVMEHKDSSKGVARDNAWSMFPVIALVVGSILKAVLYYIYATRPEVSFGLGSIGTWLLWLVGFWTSFDWIVIVLVSLTTYIDVIPFSGVMNEITETGRQYEREPKG